MHSLVFRFPSVGLRHLLYTIVLAGFTFLYNSVLSNLYPGCAKGILCVNLYTNYISLSFHLPSLSLPPSLPPSLPLSLPPSLSHLIPQHTGLPPTVEHSKYHTRIIVRDITGKYAWDCAMLYGPQMFPNTGKHCQY